MTTPEILRDHNAHALLVFKEGRAWLHAIALHQPPVRVIKLPLLERRHLRPLEYHGRPYPLPRALRLFRRAGRELGITEGAAAALRSIDQARKQEDA
jgi:hypothetical protein